MSLSIHIPESRIDLGNLVTSWKRDLASNERFFVALQTRLSGAA